MIFARIIFSFAVVVAALAVVPETATAQSASSAESSALQISWEVRNRFRMFREERDFQLHVESQRNRSILESEQALGVQSDGRGWARNTVNRLCIDLAGRVSEPCIRDGIKESYLTPTEHPVTVRLAGAIPVGAVCAWSFDDGDGDPRQLSQDCNEPINLRVRYGRATQATADVSSAEGAQQAATQIAVRDVFIAGIGDSIASGEGNPDRAIALSDEGFCFRSYIGGPSGQFYRPGRAGWTGNRSCESGDAGNALAVWQRQGALWFNAACHRSLYSYQTRTALALAVQYPHIAVTYLPLACTGATITDGLLGSMRARECLVTKTTVNCQSSVNAQLAELREALVAAKKRQPTRRLDALLLTIGANDINFSGLVADVIVDNAVERALFKQSGVIGSAEDSRASLARNLPQAFAKLREAIRPLVGAELSRVIYTSYANPTLANGAACPGGPAGFDVHPSFSADPQRLAAVSGFVQREFLPAVKAMAQCAGGVLCRDPPRDRMTLVDAHQEPFANHGFCARSRSDPEFDRQCFSPKGDSFTTDVVESTNSPMACGVAASEYRAYLPRGRWIRDANDSYFAAMTYPQGLPAAIQPADIHDATWGVLSAVYGGAVHPTAEGHAAMADAALPALAEVLRLNAADGGAEVTSEPLQSMPASGLPPR